MEGLCIGRNLDQSETGVVLSQQIPKSQRNTVTSQSLSMIKDMPSLPVISLKKPEVKASGTSLKAKATAHCLLQAQQNCCLVFCFHCSSVLRFREFYISSETINISPLSNHAGMDRFNQLRTISQHTRDDQWKVVEEK